MVAALSAVGLLACTGVQPGADSATGDGGLDTTGSTTGTTGSTTGDPAAQSDDGGATTSTGTGTGAPDPGTTATTPAPDGHRRCGWIGPGDTAGADTFVAHADWFEAIHPDWYALDSDGVHLRALTGADSPSVTAAAQQHGVALIPLVAAVEDPAYLRATLADPAKRTAHVQELVSLAVARGYAGFDLDYEKLWKASDRAGYTALLTEAAAAMHAAGKELSIAMPALADRSTNNGWDLQALSGIVDHIHVMGYDYHTLGTHSGPLAPLGWIDAALARIQSTGNASRFILGLPNYGVTPTWFAPSQEALAACGGSYDTVDTHMASCSYGVWEAGRAPHCQTANGMLYFEDVGSLEEKVAAAKKYGLGGVGYWTVGQEPEGFFDMIRKYF